MTSNLVYSTDGTTTTDLREEEVFLPEAEVEYEETPYCLVCGRCTDHWGEHDDLVEAGLAEYRSDGSVVKTDQWSAEVARSITEATWARISAELGL